MPNPNNVSHLNVPTSANFAKHFEQVTHTPKINNEIVELRKEIAELRRMMTPSIILTGQRAVEAYWELTKRG